MSDHAESLRTEIIVTRGETFARGRNRPWRTNYECTGPDGVQYQNNCKATLEQLLRRRYGPVELTIVDGHSWRREP